MGRTLPDVNKRRQKPGVNKRTANAERRYYNQKIEKNAAINMMMMMTSSLILMTLILALMILQRLLQRLQHLLHVLHLLSRPRDLLSRQHCLQRLLHRLLHVLDKTRLQSVMYDRAQYDRL